MDTLISGNSDIISLMYSPGLLSLSHDLANEKLRGMDKESRDRLFDTLSKEIFAKARSWETSPYNCIHERDDCVIIYNTFTNALARLSQDEYRQLKGKKRLKKDLRISFLENGFLLAGVDAARIYAAYRSGCGNKARNLNINIAATMRCNANCAYCYEKGVRKGDFPQKTLEATLSFIKRHRPQKLLKMTWFGGEPLLSPETMDFISAGLRSEEIEYSSYLITNGSLVTKKLIQEKFPLWNIKDVQISLDGGEKSYARRKKYKGRKKNIFSNILNSIEDIAEAGIKVHLRLNVDEGNAGEILDLLTILQERFADQNNIVYYPAFLTGINCGLDDAAKVALIKKMLSLVNDPAKFNMANRLYSMPRVAACMREDLTSFSIDPAGYVYPCEHLVGRRKETLGTVRRLFHEKNMARPNVKLRSECENCSYLPKCMGGCAENLKTGDPCCLIERYMIAAYLEYLSE